VPRAQHGISSRSHSGRLLTASALGFILLLLIGAGGAGASPILKVDRPITGAQGQVASSTQVFSSACGFANITAPAQANVTTDRLTGASESNASNQKAGRVQCLADAGTQSGLFGPSFTVNSTGAHWIAFHWRVSWAVICPAGNTTATAIGEVWVTGNVYDQNTKAWASIGSLPPASKIGGNPYHKTIAFVTCSTTDPNGSTNSSTRESVNFGFFAHLVKGQTYSFFAGLNKATDVSTSSACHAMVCVRETGTVETDLATHSRGAVLLSEAVR